MLLAGGAGSRLYALTERTAKPAVPFGGKYRIIDFTLSNCQNSGIDTVGVLTQYQPLLLNEYIGNGQPWDLDRAHGGVTVLPPYQNQKGGDWYRGTANAVYQNIHFINRYMPDYVLVLSGDHIYKMDYSRLLNYHIEKRADCTIAVIDVPKQEAGRFGIMSAGAEGKIYDFEEKPQNPRSTTASMGIYIFGRELLYDYLIKDERDKSSSNDFGKNIIPRMLSDGRALYAYPFHGYWKDVGTIDSLWEANMDLLGDRPALNLHDRLWRIYSRTYARPPHFVGPGGSLRNSIVSEGCEIYGKVENSVLFGGVKIGRGSTVKNSIIMSGESVEEETDVDYSIVGGGGRICRGAALKGERREIIVIGGGLYIPPDAAIEAGANVTAAYLAGAEKGGVSE